MEEVLLLCSPPPLSSPVCRLPPPSFLPSFPSFPQLLCPLLSQQVVPPPRLRLQSKFQLQCRASVTDGLARAHGGGGAGADRAGAVQDCRLQRTLLFLAPGFNTEVLLLVFYSLGFRFSTFPGEWKREEWNTITNTRRRPATCGAVVTSSLGRSFSE